MSTLQEVTSSQDFPSRFCNSIIFHHLGLLSPLHANSKVFWGESSTSPNKGHMGLY